MRNQAGFTLIELLVSLTLLGLLFVLLFGGLRFGSRAWERGTAVTEAGDSVRAVQNLLRSEIERTCPRRDTVATQTMPRVKFAGAATTLAFLAPAPVSAGGRTCVKLTLRQRRVGTRLRLTLSLGRNEAVLLDGVAGTELSYRTPEGAWQDDWTGETDLPALVRIRVTFPPGDARAWPELLVAPRISAEADCTYDPATKSCRGT